MICQGCNRSGAPYFTEIYEPTEGTLATVWFCRSCQARFYGTAMLMAPWRAKA